jgi:hypothetical protein
MGQHHRRTGQGGGARWPSPAWGGVVGPAVFVAAWGVLGATRAGYSPVEDAISRLAETGTATRPAMTAGFVVYGVGLAGWAVALRDGIEGPAWVPAALCAVATFGVAAVPLRPDAPGTLHAAAAVVGYAGLAAAPLMASVGLRAVRPAAARASVAVGALTAGLLAASAVGLPAHGLTQRAGLSAGDTWVVLSSVWLLRQGRPGRKARAPRRPDWRRPAR